MPLAVNKRTDSTTAATVAQPAPGPVDDGAWADRALFGVTLRTNFPFATTLAPPNGAPELIFELATAPASTLDRNGLGPAYGTPVYEPVYETVSRSTDGRAYLQIFRSPNADLLRFPDHGDFYCLSDRIVCAAPADAALWQLEILFLGTVMTYWLERGGVPMLHASAVDLGGVAIAFLASSHGGKSSLAAGFLKDGAALLTDDILPVESTGDEVLARPGFPSMRLWPELAAHFVGDFDALALVAPHIDKRRVPIGIDGFGHFPNRSRRIVRLYLPERQETGPVHIEPLRARHAMAELVRHSFDPRIVEALGWQQPRMASFARLLRQAPLRRLSYPNGLDQLKSVRDAIREDLALAAGEQRP